MEHLLIQYFLPNKEPHGEVVLSKTPPSQVTFLSYRKDWSYSGNWGVLAKDHFPAGSPVPKCSAIENWILNSYVNKGLKTDVIFIEDIPQSQQGSGGWRDTTNEIICEYRLISDEEAAVILFGWNS